MGACGLVIIVITIGEFKKGIERLPESKRKTLLRDWLNDEFWLRFHGHILPLDTTVMLTPTA